MALERLLARVLAIVPRQFVGTREFPRATLPRALVRFLAGVSSLVRLQVRTLRVHLVAACHVASVDLASLQRVAAFVVHR